MNTKSAAKLAKLSYAGLVKKCRKHVDKEVEIEGLGLVKITLKKNKYNITYVDKLDKDSYSRNYQAIARNEKYSQVRDIGSIPACLNPGRREKCSKNLALYLKTYMPKTFYHPWSPDHLKAIAKLERAMYHGDLFAFAMPRGSGKTCMTEGAALFATINGYREYVIILASNSMLADKMLNSIKFELENNDLLLEDYPEVCYPLRMLDGIGLRCKGQTYNYGIRTHIEYNSTTLVLPTIEGSKASGAVMESKGLLGKIRGSKYKKADGSVVRPDLGLIDDAQDDESAVSFEQCNKREKIIKRTVLGLAGPDKSIATVMPCTIIKKDDLSDRFLDHKRNPLWQGEISKLLYKLPDTQETLWCEYAKKRTDGIIAGDMGKEATRFYKKNRKEMDKGAITAWKDRKYIDEISALQHAENLLIKVGKEAFFSEFQNDPIESIPTLYDLTPAVVCSKSNNSSRYCLPKNVLFLVAGIDINVGIRGINYVVLGVCNDLTSYIVDYGRYPNNGVVWSSSDNQGLSEAQAIHLALKHVIDLLTVQKTFFKDEKAQIFDGVLIDCGYMTETVFRACESLNRSFNCPIMPSRGRGSKGYKQNNIIGTPGNNFHKTEWVGKGKVIVHNSDFWKMYAQKGFLLSPGMPSSISLYGEEPKAHEHFANSICCEILSEVVKGDLHDYYNWSWRPGNVNDLLDALIMALVAGGLCGASITGGEKSWRSKPKPRVNNIKKGRITYY